MGWAVPGGLLHYALSLRSSTPQVETGRYISLRGIVASGRVLSPRAARPLASGGVIEGRHVTLSGILQPA